MKNQSKTPLRDYSALPVAFRYRPLTRKCVVPWVNIMSRDFVSEYVYSGGTSSHTYVHVDVHVRGDIYNLPSTPHRTWPLTDPYYTMVNNIDSLVSAK